MRVRQGSRSTGDGAAMTAGPVAPGSTTASCLGMCDGRASRQDEPLRRSWMGRGRPGRLQRRCRQPAWPEPSTICRTTRGIDVSPEDDPRGK
jgi:hypothetical protein